MLDLNKEAERAESRRAAKLAALAAVANLTLEEQKTALIEAVVEVDGRLKGKGRTVEKAQKGSRQKPARVTISRREPIGDASGPTAFIKQALKSAAPRFLTAPELRSLAEKNREKFDADQILQCLTRMINQKTAPIVRQGRPGNFRYGLPGAAGPVGSSVNDTTATDKVVAALRSNPTRDYSALAKTVYGISDPASRRKLRNTLYYLRREGNVRQRQDGSWEVTAA